MTYARKLRINGFALLFAVFVHHCSWGTEPAPNSAANLPVEKKKVLKVKILQSATHIALDKTRQGIIASLIKGGYIEGQSLHIVTESAQGNPALSSQIASKFTSQEPDLIFTLGTLSTLSFLKAVHEDRAKVIFVSVTDPIGSKIVDNLTCRPHQVSGVSNFVDIKPQIDMIREIQPEITKLGIIYNPTEINSVHVVEILRKICKEMNITLKEQTVTRTSELPQASASLVEQVEAVYVGNDNTALSGFKSIVNSALKKRIPVYSSDVDQVKEGALAAKGPNQFSLGVQAAEMAVRHLQGMKLSEMAIEYPKITEIHINMVMAQALNLQIKDSLLLSSKVIRTLS
ncbi:MAG: ABC transporter substrate-binding protein [Candidatus Puniceispirillum sp.]|nr:ABC transporter substrate-binding protein [Candidatus Pelagibacter sp.]MBA4283569.1 ABC transporter substrate-binding protein [Candidatus Puniceispirillum sp.]